MPPKKVATKKKKSAPKKAAAKKTAPKKAAAKKGASKQSAPRKRASPKKQTTIIAKIDVGFGNKLYIRGEGGGLDWNKGQLMNCKQNDEWTWSTEQANSGIVFKFLLNDQLWSLGEDMTVAAGGKSVTTPRF